MPVTIEQYDTLSPLFASLDGRSEVEQAAMMQQFASMSDAEKAALAGVETAEAILGWIQGGLIPESHGKAVAKIIYLVLTGEIPQSEVAAVLQRLDIPEVSAGQIAANISTLIAPALAARSVAERPAVMPKVPPLTVQRPAVIGSNTPPRNIIDLRKPPEAS